MMENTKKELTDAILYLADQYDLKGYKELIDGSPPTLVRIIVYDLFVLGFNEYDCTAESFEAYILIRNYARELKQNGFVKFKQKQ